MPKSRTSRSDAGVLALTRSIMTEVFGLSGATAGKLMKVIRSAGEYQTLKQSLRSMDSVAYRRINQVIEMLEKAEKDTEADDEFADEEGNKENNNGEEMKTESFLGYLLNELQIDADRISSDPEVKQDVMRLARASGSQAEQMQKRMQRDKMRNTRQAIQQEEDPQKQQIRRRIMNLEQQLQKARKELENTGQQ